MNVEIIDPLSAAGWDALVEAAPEASFFHASAWARVLCDSYRYRPHYAAAIEAGRLEGLIPVMEVDSRLTGRRGVALPFTDECQPLAADPAAFEALFAEVAAHGRQAGWKSVEFRGGERFFSRHPAAARYLVHTLALEAGEGHVLKRFDPGTRRNIRRAERDGVAVALERSAGAMEAYYRLHCGTRRHHGLPPQPRFFFRRIHAHAIAPGRGFVALARHRSRVIAGAVFLLFRGQAVYKFGASDRRFLDLRPNHLVMWEAIRRCCSSGVRTFHFGRTEPENEGLLRFKRGWGASERPLHYFRYDLKAGAFAADAARRTSYPVFKLLPVPLLRLAGSLIYRHVG